MARKLQHCSWQKTDVRNVNNRADFKISVLYHKGKEQ